MQIGRGSNSDFEYKDEAGLAAIKEQGPGEYDILYHGFKYKIIVGNIEEDNVGITFDGWGGGGASTSQNLIDYLSTNRDNSNTINVIPHDSASFLSNDAGKETADNLLYNINKEFNVNSNMLFSGHSASGKNALDSAINYCEEYGNNGNKVYAVMMDPVDKSYERPINYARNIEEYKDLCEKNNITIINISGNPIQTETNDLIKSGVPFINVKYKITKENGTELSWDEMHGITQRLMADNGFVNISSGDFNFKNLITKYKDSSIGNVNIEYSFEISDGNGNLKEIDDVSELNQIFARTVHMNFLSANEIIKSDGSFLSNNMSEISSMLYNSSLNQSSFSSVPCSSTTDVPSQELDIVTEILNTCKVLFEKIQTELVMINEIGDEFREMDNFLARQANELDFGMNEIKSTKSSDISMGNYTEKEFENGVHTNISTKTDKIKEEWENNTTGNVKEEYIDANIVDVEKNSSIADMQKIQ